MAQVMNDEQRLKALEAYDPREHLISVGKNKDNSPVLYYPAAWRLYELRLRHPHFVLESEIAHMNEETGLVIIKAIGYDGLDYATSRLKGIAYKQGKIFEMDKVETKAKSRIARDIGIGTEYALDMDADETDATHAPVQPQRAKVHVPELDLADVSVRVGKAFSFKPEEFETRWIAYKQHVLSSAKPDEALTQPDIKKLLDYAIQHEKKTASVAKAS